ncbi:unnamed protein product [Arctia plantaginis]|uniref:Uncharacterized protein n=1 Tax=Arctia plantaginis TaxID=874455 RepID=A0A8S1BK49_ARCPL|nr:unnamed protein product [Arctia plantaginis]
MYRDERDGEPSPPRSRSSSRRSSASLSRRSSIKKDKEVKNTLSSTPSSANSTPKKTVKAQNLELLVTGKQLLKRSDRANSLPGSYRRPSTDSPTKTKKPVETKRPSERICSQSSKSQETSVEDDMSLDLSQVSDFEDTNSKYGVKKFQALATSTPKVIKGKPRSASLQSQIHSQRVETRRALKSLDSTKQSFSYSRDSFKTSSTSSPHRYGPELDYSSVSPEYSGQSSTDMSPRASQLDQILSPKSQDLQLSSCCISTWADCSEPNTKVEHRCDGEWTSFWANYNNSVSKVPMKNYYDQCPTPYRTDTFDLADFGEVDFSDCSRKRSPDNIDALNNIIRNQGLHLTPRETQNIIKCAHLLGNVLTKAIERRSNSTDTEDPELLLRKKTMKLDLKETVIPADVKEEKRSETVTTQTDISLPNTKSAPRIFENILRQLSRSSIDVGKIENKDKTEEKKEKTEVKEKLEVNKESIEETAKEAHKEKDEVNKEKAEAVKLEVNLEKLEGNTENVVLIKTEEDNTKCCDQSEGENTKEIIKINAD